MRKAKARARDKETMKAKKSTVSESHTADSTEKTRTLEKEVEPTIDAEAADEMKVDSAHPTAYLKPNPEH